MFDKSCVHLGYILGISWIYIEFILSVSQVHLGYILGTFWVHIKYISGPFELYLRYIWGTYMVHLSYILSIVWRDQKFLLGPIPGPSPGPEIWWDRDQVQDQKYDGTVTKTGTRNMMGPGPRTWTSFCPGPGLGPGLGPGPGPGPWPRTGQGLIIGRKCLFINSLSTDPEIICR